MQMRERAPSVEDIHDEPAILIFRVRRARLKAMKAAVAEALSLLAQFQPILLPGGPLGDQPGLFWLQMQENDIRAALDRLPLLGYSFAVDKVEFNASKAKRKGRKIASTPTWRGRPFDLESLYNEDSDELREQAPDRRSFLLQDEDGSLKEVRGYRGDSGQLSRRGLPVADARLLANLAFVREGGRLLDPFAGAGGIVLAALGLKQEVFSLDIDPFVKWGLQHQGALHCVGDARNLPFRDGTFDSVATETPFEVDSCVMADAMDEIARILRPGGHAALMVVERQADSVRERARRSGLTTMIDIPIDRKGLDVIVLAWTKTS